MSLNLQAQGALRWPHWQRLAERWWRRWVYALTGLALGFFVLWLLQPEVGENHAQAQQAVAGLQQQLDTLSRTASKPPEPAPISLIQRYWTHLPDAARQGQLWTDWQQVLAAHGLRLKSLQPVALGGLAASASTAGGSEQRSSLPHQAAALRVRGRFEDWTRLWAACAEAGPVCSLDRIRVAATEQASEVQIDVVLRLWMRPGEAAQTAQGGANAPEAAALAQQTDWTAPLLQTFGPHSDLALFVSDTPVGADMALRPAQPPATAASGESHAAADLEALPQDPRQWPLARVRLAGLWQQGSERQAILSAGTQWARVSWGQRVTLEGHRVVAITDRGVSLRLASGPVIQLDWQAPVSDVKSTGGEP